MQFPLDIANIASLIARYLHIVCATLLVGGTLFYEMVVPIAIADLRPEAQLAIFGRARWVFRQIVWGSALVIVLSGIISGYRQYPVYIHGIHALERPAFDAGFAGSPVPPIPAARPGWWLAAHIAVGTLAVVIALLLTIGSSPPGHPIRWMRLNLVILMIVIFLGSATRQVRLNIEEQRIPAPWPIVFPTTQPGP
jgi:hypothetical protein